MHTLKRLTTSSTSFFISAIIVGRSIKRNMRQAIGPLCLASILFTVLTNVLLRVPPLVKHHSILPHINLRLEPP